MSGFNDDAVKQKLSALNESQDSIVSVAQWLMFHKRHANRTAELWLHRLKDPSTTAAKRLNLMYLANELVQQSKAKKKDDILAAFSPLVGEGMIIAYKGAPPDVQNKLKRVSEVWRQRNIFDQASQEAIEAQIMEIDKSRPPTTRKALGGALFPTDGAHSSTPVELQPLVHIQQSLSKAHVSIRPALDPANKAYAALTSSATALPSPPLYAAKLNALAKDLAHAEAAVAETLKTRQNLIAGLEKLLKSNRAAVAEEEKQHAEIRSRRTEVEGKKRDVEDAIMRGLSSSEDLHSTSSAQTDFHLGERPEVETFTPPPASPMPSTLAPVHATLPLPPEGDPSVGEPPASIGTVPAAPVVHAEDLARSSTPPGMPPTYQYGRGHNGNFYQGDGTITPEEVLPTCYDGMYDPPITAHETFTPPPAPVHEHAYFEPSAFATAPVAAAQPRTTVPGLSTLSATTSLDPRKRPASTVNAALDPRRRMNGKATSPTKRKRTSDDEFAVLPGLGGENGLEGLDKEVVGMLG